MNKLYQLAAALALLCLAGIAQANITIDIVTVGDPGNAGELSGAGAGGYGPDRVCGSVAYTYNIGKYEVTTAQYTAFLNAVAKTDTYGLYNALMDTAVDSKGCNIKRVGTSGNFVYTVGSGSSTDVANWGNRPVNYVSYWDSCRFANWLCNGQGTGSTETGAYTLNGYTGTDGRTIGRNAGWKWAVTSEDEWYKAAYYDPKVDAYWDYPTQSNTAPANQVPSRDPGNSANYVINNNYSIGSPYYRTNVGDFENSGSAYGTFDQGGNVREWNETIPYIIGDLAYRGLRGRSFNDYSSYQHRALQASYSSVTYDPGFEIRLFGFRVSQVPEPSSIIALAGGLVGLLALRRHRA